MLYSITDRNQTRGRSLVDVVKSALDGGVRLIQLREKELSGKELFNLAKELRTLTNQYKARLFINDRLDIAMAVGADGVHLGRESMSVRDVKRAVHPGESPLIVGVSTHSIQEALEAESDGADFITFGPVYHTLSKAKYGEPVGIERLKEAAETVKIPVFALGGIKTENIAELKSAGAYGVAVISAIMAAVDVKTAAEDILKHLARYADA